MVATRIFIALLLMFMVTKISPAGQAVSRLVFGSCIKQDLPIPILYTMRKERPDLLLFIGDNIYADTEDMQVMRDDLIKTTKAEGVFFVSGDRHWSELSMIHDAASYPIYVLTSSSFNQIHQHGTPTENLHRISETTYHRENYGLIKINWQTPDPQVTMQIKDIEGGVRIETQFAASQLR